MTNEKRLIDANKLVNKARWMEELDNDGIPVDIKAVPLLCVEDAPTVDVAPVVHGQWIKRPDERICPFCSDRYSYFGGKEKNFCSNCDAKMDGDTI